MCACVCVCVCVCAPMCLFDITVDPWQPSQANWGQTLGLGSVSLDRSFLVVWLIKNEKMKNRERNRKGNYGPWLLMFEWTEICMNGGDQVCANFLSSSSGDVLLTCPMTNGHCILCVCVCLSSRPLFALLKYDKCEQIQTTNHDFWWDLVRSDSFLWFNRQPPLVDHMIKYWLIWVSVGNRSYPIQYHTIVALSFTLLSYRLDFFTL